MKTALTLATLALTLALTGCGASVGAYAPVAAQQAVAGGGANARAVAPQPDTAWAEGLGKLTIAKAVRTTRQTPTGHWAEDFVLTGTTDQGPFRLTIHASNKFPNGGTSYVSMALAATFNERAVRGPQAAALGALLDRAAEALGQDQQWVVHEAAQTLRFNRLGR